jgi:hypothetical protein
MKNQSAAARRGRPYVARFCACGEEAIYAVQLVVRTLGPGSRANRKAERGHTILLCGRCARDAYGTTVEPLFRDGSGCVH